ncbi:MAG: CRTAC1 family protein, partial [Bacteroidota bacterium]
MTRSLYVLILLALPAAAFAQPGPFVQDTNSLLTQVAKPSLSALWGDFDGDGDLDLVVSNNTPGNDDDLYRNSGAGTFTRIDFATNEDPFAVTTSGAWADFDNDGRLDLSTASLMDGALFLNRGPTNFRYIRLPLDRFERTRDVLVADYNGDGLLDGVLSRGLAPGIGFRNVLIENIGNTGIVVDDTEINDNVFESTTGCWGDINADGFADLHVNTNGGDPNELYINEAGTLVRAADPSLSVDYGRTQSCSWGDFDGDGDLDIVTTSFEAPTRLFRNEGVFTDATAGLDTNPVSSVGSAWGDVDNDGDLDLVIVRDDAINTLYLNDGAGQFTGIDFGPSDSESPRVVLADDDGDGDLDIYVARGGFTRSQRNLLYRNTTTGAANRLSTAQGTARGGSANWLEVDLQRTSGRNRFGVGALVTAYASIGGQQARLLRSATIRSGLGAQSGYRLHFGLGDAATVDSLVVAWPAGVGVGGAGDQPTVLTGVAANQILTVTGDEDEAARAPVAASTAQPAAFAVEAVYPNPSAGAVTIAV